MNDESVFMVFDTSSGLIFSAVKLDDGGLLVAGHGMLDTDQARRFLAWVAA